MKLKKNTTKIYVTLAVWALLALGMFVYGFKVVENSNIQSQGKLDALNSELSLLQAERDGFNKAKKDLDTLAGRDLQPEDFYSKDTTLVNEIRFFEGLADRVGVKMQLSGPSGTVQTAPKAKSLSGEIIFVPLNITVTGPFPKVLEFAQAMENLPFATQVTAFNLSTLSGSEVSASFGGSFYLRK